jgi:hypothetical protein
MGISGSDPVPATEQSIRVFGQRGGLFGGRLSIVAPAVILPVVFGSLTAWAPMTSEPGPPVHRADGADGDNSVADRASEWSRRRSGAAGHRGPRRSRRWSRRSLDPRRQDNYSGGRQRQRGGRSNQHRHTVPRRQHLKPFITTIVLQLVDDGRIDLDETLSTYLPDTEQPTYNRCATTSSQPLTGTASDHETRRKPCPPGLSSA